MEGQMTKDDLARALLEANKNIIPILLIIGMLLWAAYSLGYDVGRADCLQIIR